MPRSKEYVPCPEVNEVRTRIQKQRRLEREWEGRAEWTKRDEGDGLSRDYWRRENRDDPVDSERLADALSSIL